MTEFGSHLPGNLVHAMSRRDSADGSPHWIVPVVTLSLTTLLACVDGWVGSQPVAVAGSRASDASDLSTPPSAASRSADGATPAGVPSRPTVRRPLVAPTSLAIRLVRAVKDGRVTFSIDGGYRILDRDGGATNPDPTRVAALGSRLNKAVAEVRGGRVFINQVAVGGDRVTVRPDRSGSLVIAGQSYHGELVLDASSGTLHAQNRVDVEDYLAGVVHAEMPSRFATEARRAQAVVSRTYAIFHAMRGDVLRDDQGSQVYAGLAKDSAEARRVVDSTRGELLTWDGQPFETFFHSTCGGATGSATRIFKQTVPPPLAHGVGCGACEHSPHYEWVRTLNQTRLDGMYPGSRGVRVEFGERDESGRCLDVAIVDGQGRALDRASATKLRQDYNRGLPLAQQIPSSLWSAIEDGDSGQRVVGRGFGHGVGLCQYGADGLARRGRGYRDILAYYYPDSDITRVWD